MNVLIIGSGAREHAIAWKLSSSPMVTKIFIAPGNAGTDSIGTNLYIAIDDLSSLAYAAERYRIDLTIVGSEVSLAAGVVDFFEANNLVIIGPTKAAARIETSKSFAKSIMKSANVPTAKYELFTDPDMAIKYINSTKMPVVVKVDGLAAGKGVTVCQTKNDALNAIKDALIDHKFGESGSTILIEEMLLGNEISVFSFTDGSYLTSLIAASDYKRALKGNLGPNTGGMGSFSPPRNWSNELAEEINLKIMKPVVRELGLQGSPFKGILYGGIILTAQGPKVIEFNCRFGDPEAQVIIPRMKTDLMEVFSSIANRTLRNCVIEWDDNSCVSVVLCSAGYPSEHKAGAIITGFEKLPDNILTFHAGTSIITKPNGVKLITVSGGRVINLVSKGTTLSEASSSVYDNINSIKFLGSFFRTDIGVF